MRNVLGLDLSLTATGVAVLAEDTSFVFARVIKTQPKDGTQIERADFIGETICAVISEYKPHRILIEDYAFSRGTMMFTLGELGGIIKHMIWLHTGHNSSWLTVPSTTVKKFATGNGHAKKPEMIEAAAPWLVTKDDNVADAIHIARYALHKYPLD